MGYNTEKELTYATYQELILAIQNQHYMWIEEYIKHKELDHGLLDFLFEFKDEKAFQLMIPHITNIPNKTEVFFKLGDINLKMALIFFKQFEHDLLKESYFQEDSLIYDNYYSEELHFGSYFNTVPNLSRFYSPIHFQNTIDLFAHMLLDSSLKCVQDFSISQYVLDYLLTHKEQYHIKDEVIVQFLVETSHSLEYESENWIGYPERFNQLKENLVNLIYLLVQHGVSFESDVNGYLYQIVGMNEVDNIQHIFKEIQQNGSSLNNFIFRVEDPQNWLSPQEFIILDNYDFNNDRQYNIYRKFNEENFIKPHIMDIAYQLKELSLPILKPQLK